jgi:hypothetical protein
VRNCFRYLILLLPLSCGGCITASLATLGTVLGAVGTAASTGSDVYHLGKLEAAVFSNATDCHAAALLASIDLDLRLKIDQRTDKPQQVWEMTLVDKFDTPVGIHIEYRTAKFCLCRVDVGIFGSEPTAHLFMDRIRAHLHLPPPPSTQL